MAPITSSFIAASILAAYATAQALNPQLVGTWTTKSGKVLTGPGFYDPAKEYFTEPALTGISYSFSADGHFEEAYYRAIANPTDPPCPQAMIQWQHGSYITTPSGGMKLIPITSDGRSLTSNPCVETEKKTATLSRYAQNETMSKVEVGIDEYTKTMRLDLYGFDGTPLNPMWLVSQTPRMLPTTTLAVSSSTASAANSKIKRTLDAGRETIVRTVSNPQVKATWANPNLWFWSGASMIGAGSILVLFF